MRWVRAGGLAAGLLAAVVLIAGFRVPRGTGVVGADVTIICAPTGELDVAPAGACLRAPGLTAGRGAGGRIRIRNQTGSTLDVSVRALPSSAALDPVLDVELAAGAVVLYRGPLGGLRAWSRPFGLAPGTGAILDLTVGLGSEAAAAAEGQILDVPLDLRAQPREGR